MSESVPSYHVLSRWLHWLIAGLIVFMIALGWGLNPGNPHVLAVAFWHKSSGILVLLLSLVRIGLRFSFRAPPEPPMPAWQALSARVLHGLFYVAMIGMPLTGWAMVSTSAREIPFFVFDWFHLPVPPTEAAHELFEALHDVGAKVLTWLMIPLHVAAALKHHLVDRDTVMERMMPGLRPKPLLNWRWLVPVSVVAVAILASQVIGAGGKKPAGQAVAMEPAAAAAVAEIQASTEPSASASAEVEPVTRWTLQKTGTSLGWSTTFQGETIDGAFDRFSADIAFDPDRLEASRVTVRIDLASSRSGDADRDTTVQGGQFFATEQFPQAVFDAKRFTAIGNGRYIAHGKLTLHGVTRAVDLPFTLSIKGDRATVSGETVVDRTVFGVGSGEFTGTDMVPAKVKVVVRLNAATSTQKGKPE
ncbi:hypothetical protein ABAC460_13250 [Asticcacaulis sp. AC460]|uniref:YceI family protein n=1 Tax=Asticcacaulis sp. AC460 TaxID=1282360 RepID=UPI0003C3DE92|nr:YceI family protein [Asticcacaulis sp. AC460]ESQ89258.1 hypothetical protein ABAC460_13250 [Asticcacaulis sp. AC460]